MKKIFVSIDIETTGPIPGIHGMMSVGAVAYNEYGNKVASFARNLEIWMYDWNEDTRRWWYDSERQHAFNLATKNPIGTVVVAHSLKCWLLALTCDEDEVQVARVYPVCFPVHFDMPFINYYLYKYASFNIWDYKKQIASPLDLTSFMRGAGLDYDDIFTKRSGPHHCAIDDARHQGDAFMKAWLEVGDENETGS